MQRYKYRAINARGRPIRGAIAAASEADLYKQLQSAGLELIDCSPIGEGGGSTFWTNLTSKRIVLRDVIQFFVQMLQMQSAGVPMLDALSDIRDASENQKIKDMLTDIHRDVSDGSALSEALARHPKVFKPLYISLVEAGEETGDLTSSYRQLVHYLKWVDVIQAKMRKATRYPIMVTFAILVTVVVLMGSVVPQVTGFLKFLDMELPWFTIWLINTSDFFVKPVFTVLGLPVYGSIIVLAVPTIIILFIKAMRKSSDNFAYRMDSLYVRMPVFGVLIRKISIARYAQTFGALYASGIDVIRALQSARETVHNLFMINAMETVEAHIQTGSTLSKAFDASGEFPSLVVRMVRIGEESGNLTPVLEQVSEFYTADVNEAIDSMIEMIQPVLTAVLGLIILWIAVGSLGPIYMNFDKFMDF